jgi:protease I
MNISGKHVAVLVHNYFEQSEFEEPIRALKDAGAEVTVISADKKSLRGMRHVELADKFTADLLLSEASAYDYDALVLPGGAINSDSLRMIEEARNWILDFMESDRPVAAICHAPWLLVSSDSIDGRRLTSYQSIQDDINNAGGEWINQPIVIDGNLITSRQPDDIPMFNEAIISMLKRQPSSVMQTGADTVVARDETMTEEDARMLAMGYDRKLDDLNRSDEDDILEDAEMDDSNELQPSIHSHSRPNYEEDSDTY